MTTTMAFAIGFGMGSLFATLLLSGVGFIGGFFGTLGRRAGDALFGRKA